MNGERGGKKEEIVAVMDFNPMDMLCYVGVGEFTHIKPQGV